MSEPLTDADLDRWEGMLLSPHHDDLCRLIAEVRRLRAVKCVQPNAAKCALEWEADHQRRHLEVLWLAEEFPYGCDAIEHVAAALLAAREEVRRLRAIDHDYKADVIAVVEKLVTDFKKHFEEKP